MQNETRTISNNLVGAYSRRYNLCRMKPVQFLETRTISSERPDSTPAKAGSELFEILLGTKVLYCNLAGAVQFLIFLDTGK